MLKMGCAAVEFGLTDCLNIHKFAKPIEQVPKFLKTSSPAPTPTIILFFESFDMKIFGKF
jgi:hypothetical protein